MKHENLFSEKEIIKVHLVGCGGTGSQMLTGLARMAKALESLGICELQVTAYDDDLVSVSNVGRQLFSPADVGCYKSSVLINRMNLFFGYQWKAVNDKYGKSRRGEIPHIVISCVDTKKARKEIYEVIHKDPCYWMDLGNSSHSGQAIIGNADYAHRGPSTKNSYSLMPCVADLYPEILDDTLPEDNTPSCSLAEALEKQDLMVNQFVATNALELLWQLLKEGEIEHHGFFFNAKQFSLRGLPIDKARWRKMLRDAHKYRKAQAERVLAA